MTQRWILTAITVSMLHAATLLASDEGETTNHELATTTAKLSYALGMDIGGSLKELGEEIDMASFVRGVDDKLKDASPLLTPEQIEQIKKQAFARIQQRQMLQRDAKGQKNTQEGQTFLAKNKEQEGVITTASGLQYLVMRQGDGDKPTAEDRVKVHYRGTLLDGTEFDSSYKRDQAVTFPLKGVIAGWTEALQLMSVGSQYKLFIPPDLAYGQRGSGPQIGPNATLVFEVELLEIQKQTDQE